MPRHTTEGGRILVVHLATQDSLTPGIEFRRRRLLVQRGRWPKQQEPCAQAGAKLGKEVGDATLLATIKAKLIRESKLDGFDINVDVEQGKVLLRGTIPSEEARVLAIQSAWALMKLEGASARKVIICTSIELTR